MQKIDEDALRRELTKAWDLPIPAEEGAHREKVLMLRRAFPLMVELAVFTALEMTRNSDNPMQGIVNLAEAIATGVSNACENIADAGPVPKGAMNAAHTAIHLFTKTVDEELHHLHYERGNKIGNVVEHATVTVPFKEVGDA